MNGLGNSDFNLLVSCSTHRELLKTKRDITLQKALEPLMKRWGLNVNKVTFQLRYYQYDLKHSTIAGDTEGAEVYVVKGSESGDKLLKGFNPFVNKTSLKTFTQPYSDKNGWYLTRESSSGNGQFSLAVTFENQLRHFKINFSDDDGTYKVASKPFENLHELFYYYSTHPVKKTPEGDIFLSHPIPCEKKPENDAQTSIQSLPVENVGHKLSSQNEPKKVQGSRPLPPLPPPGPTSPLSTSDLPTPLLSQPPNPQPPPPVAPKITTNIPNIKSNFNSKTLPRKKSKVNQQDTLESRKLELTSRPLPPIPPPDEKPIDNPKRAIPELKKKPNNLLPNHALSINPRIAKSNPHLDCIPVSQQPKQNAISPVSNSQPFSPTSASFSCSQSVVSNLSSHSEEAGPTVPSRGSKPLNKQLPPAKHSTGSFSKEPACMTDNSLRNNHPKISVSSSTAPTSNDVLPPNWVHVYSKSKAKYYYYNQKTLETKWTHPTNGKDASSKQVESNDDSRPVSAEPPPLEYSRQRSLTSADLKRPMNKPSLPAPPTTNSFSAVPNGNGGENHRAHTGHNGSHALTQTHHSPEPSLPAHRVFNKSKSFKRNEKPQFHEYDYLPGFEGPDKADPLPLPARNIKQPLPSKNPTPPHSPGPLSSSNSTFSSNMVSSRIGKQANQLNNHQTQELSSKPSKNPTPPHSPGPLSSSNSSFSSNMVSSRIGKQANQLNNHQTQELSSKHSAPVTSTPMASVSQGKPVKVGKHIIPAPPPNIPPASCAIAHNPSSSQPSAPMQKCTTLPQSSRSGLLKDIEKAATVKKLRPVSPKRRSVRESNNSLLGVLRKNMEARKGMIQDSDQSDSSYEDADEEWSLP